MIFDSEQSRTWPFETLHEDIPDGLIKDANIVCADSCVITGVLVSGGCVYISAEVTKDNVTTEIYSRAVQMADGVKVRLYNAVGKCYGWLMLGRTQPETLTVQGVSYDLCVAVCQPAENPASANRSGMTGDWTVVPGDGITVSHEYPSGGPLTITIGADDDWFKRPSPDDVDRTNGNGIYSIGGTRSQTITLTADTGQFFVHGAVATLVPELRVYTLDVNNNMLAKHVFYINQETEWLGPDGSVRYDDGKFTVTINQVTRVYSYIGELQAYTDSGSGRYDVLTTQWEGCPIGDMIRTNLSTSAEDGSNKPYPLDEILTGSNI